MLDDPERIERKFRRAVTDSGDGVRSSPDKPGITNLIDILAAVRGVAPAEIEREFEPVGYGDFKPAVVEAELADARGYGDLKAAVGEAVTAMLAPVREHYVELRADEPALERILGEGAEKARTLAAATLADVRECMGVGASREAQLPR